MDSTCRLCAVQSSSLTSVFSIKNTRLVVDAIQVICPIKIEINDSLPHQICTRCLKTVFEAVELREKSVLSDLNFRSNRNSLPEAVIIKEENTIFIEEPASHVDEDSSKEASDNDDDDDDEDFLPLVSYEPQAKRMKSETFSCKFCDKKFSSQAILRNHSRICRPSEDVNATTRYSNPDHLIQIIANSKRRRCRAEGCTSIVNTECSKCDVGLCIKCFSSYHTK